MIVRAADLRPEGLELDLEFQLAPLSDVGGLGIEVTRARVIAGVTPAPAGLRCAGRIDAEIRVPCARCLELFPIGVNRVFDLSYRVPSGAGSLAPEMQVPRGELDLAWLEEGGSINLETLAAEQIYLELPMKPLCAPDCLGLCRRCGANINNKGCECAGSVP